MLERLSRRLVSLRLSIPLARLGWRYLDDGDVWRQLEYDVPLSSFGAGAVHPFEWYLHGKSSVDTTSLDSICDWLIGCEYVRDRDLFQVGDFWQHPSTFEQLRRGDCEDHALWAWRKLRELNIDSEFVVGQWVQGDGVPTGFHAWIVLRQSQKRFLLETVSKDRGDMLTIWDDAKPQYIPHVSIDTSLTRRIYAGAFKWLSDERDRRKGIRRSHDTPGRAAAHAT